MGTRSTIALEFADGTVQQVYCHWDGYLDYNGKILFENYSDPFKLRDLIDLGDLSSLGANIGEQHSFDEKFDAETLADTRCTFYARDRGETGVEAKKFKSFEDYEARHQYEEYEYILRNIDGKAVWFVKCHSEDWKTLEQAFAEEQSGVIA